MAELPHSENVRYPDDLERARHLAGMEGNTWAKFEKELDTRIPSFVEKKYPNTFSDTHKEEVCEKLIARLKANNGRVLAQFRGECLLSTYIGKQLNWAIKDWLRKNSDRLFEIEADSSGEERRSDSVPDTNDEDTRAFPESMTEEEVFGLFSALRDEWRWAFLLRYYYFFGFPPSEIRALAKKRSVPIMEITELLIKCFEEDKDEAILRQVEKKERVLESLGRINERIRRLYTEERSLSLDSVDDDQSQVEDRRIEIAEQKRTLEEKRKTIRNKERHVITTPYRAIAEILGETSEDTVRGFVFSARRQLQALHRQHMVTIGRQEGMSNE